VATSRGLRGPLAEGKKKDLLRLLNPRHRVAVHEVERQVLEPSVAAEVDDCGARASILPVVVDDDPADGDLCMNQTVAARLRRGSIMTSMPSTRRLLDGVAIWSHASDSPIDLRTDRNLVVEIREGVYGRPIHVTVHSQQSDLLRW